MNYEIIDIKYIEDKMKIIPPYDIYTLIDVNDVLYKVFINYDWYNNLTYTNISWFDNRANGFDLAKVLYNHDRNLFFLLPEKYITREMENDFNKNSEIKIKKTKYKTMEEEIRAYNKEELRHLNILDILSYKHEVTNIESKEEKNSKKYMLKLRKNI